MNQTERIEFLDKVLDQVFSYGCAPKLPDPLCDQQLRREYDLFYGQDEYTTFEDYVSAERERRFPHGENTVEFFGADELYRGEECPELAQWLKEREGK